MISADRLTTEVKRRGTVDFKIVTVNYSGSQKPFIPCTHTLIMTRSRAKLTIFTLM